jgi:putative transport protein
VVKEFGLILFVYCVGLQVGPSFFSSMKQGGVKLNSIALAMVALNLILAFGIFYLDGRIDFPMIVGMLCGAVTNTPGLGAANEALNQMNYTGDPIALAYACAYPLGVVGIIVSIVIVRYICKVNLKKEEDEILAKTADSKDAPKFLYLEVSNENLDGKTLPQVSELIGRSFVCSRIRHDGHVSIPNKETKVYQGDVMYVVCSDEDKDSIISFIGKEVTIDWEAQDAPLVSKRILVTKNDINGKTLGSLNLRSIYGVNVTRIHRSGLQFFADPHFRLMVGDRVVVVGRQNDIDRVGEYLGNELKHLDSPQLAAIFVGIALGIIFGSIPIAFPGIPTPVKLGLSGGPLIIAILIGSFGYKLKLITYTTQSANLMLREVGISLFLASVGIESGGGFVDALVQGDGVLFVGYGLLLTMVPIILVGVLTKFILKLDYFTIAGIIAGTYTNPSALSYSSLLSNKINTPAISYSTVYPLSMFLRILTAQVLILIMM